MIAIVSRQLARPDLSARVKLLGAASRTGALAWALLSIAACGGGGGGTTPGGNNCTGVPGLHATLQSIDVTPPNPSVAVGKTLALIAVGHYSDASCAEDPNVTWSSATTSVATIDNGLLSALATGSAAITATDNNVAGSTTVTVTPGPGAVSYLFSFGSMAGSGGQPNGPLLQASDGNFYGTTAVGSGNICDGLQAFCGVLFKMTPAGAETVLYNFGASATDGYRPSAPLIQTSDGNFYGTTAEGGTFAGGTVFKMTPAGVETVLYSFGASLSDGTVPAALIQGQDGNFYGTTAQGGANNCASIPGTGNNCGTVFKITPAGVETVLYSFGGSATDGFEPLAPLVQASDGNFYGTTSSGGVYGGGTVFRITPGGAETVLYSFGASPSNGSPPQGFIPQGALIQASDGSLYGTTAEGGSVSSCQYGCGTVFRITLDGTESVLYSFAGYSASDGYGPAPFLIQGSDGNFYGTTRSGGAFGGDLNGTAFRITPSGVETVLYSFGPLNTNPSDPAAGVIQGSDGAFYGVTIEGNTAGSGTVFKLTAQ
jgi:uncharacterized repeat protein (TIGR03803 family)